MWYLHLARYLFGDCCHPKSVGAMPIEEGKRLGLFWMGKECLDKDYKHWEKRIKNEN